MSQLGQKAKSSMRSASGRHPATFLSSANCAHRQMLQPPASPARGTNWASFEVEPSKKWFDANRQQLRSCHLSDRSGSWRGPPLSRPAQLNYGDQGAATGASVIPGAYHDLHQTAAWGHWPISRPRGAERGCPCQNAPFHCRGGLRGVGCVPAPAVAHRSRRRAPPELHHQSDWRASCG
jgi:hypothetical protein